MSVGMSAEGGSTGARIFEIGDFGIRRAEWGELELVRHWQRFLTTPESYLRHLSHAD